MITYTVEKWREFYPELKDLLPLHWEEIALHKEDVPLDVDVDRYNELADKGCLLVIVVREDGNLIGYHISIISTHLHYKSTLHAITDVFYIRPEHRKGFVGLRLFQFAEEKQNEERKRLGYKLIKLYTASKTHLDISKVFEYLKYTETERLFTKVIGD